MRAFASQKGPGKGLPASGFAPETRIAPEPDLLEAQRPVLTPGMDQMAGMFRDNDSFNQPLNNWNQNA